MGAHSEKKKTWFYLLLFKDFHPINVNSSNAEVDSAQMVQYIVYINMKTDVFQKLSHPFREPFKKSCFTNTKIGAAKSDGCKRTKTGLSLDT